jgi:diamine N-acetyltransferase
MENEKIRLRQLEPEDLEILYLWENDVNVWNVSNTFSPYSRFVLKQYIENSHRDIFESGELRLIIEDISTNKPVGTVDLFDFNPLHSRAGLGILIYDKSDRRKGFATAALNLLIDYCFKILQLHQIFCTVDENNEKSLKMLLGVGFEIVGTKKEWLKTPTGWHNEILLQKIASQE